jgi:hypothetical protein
VLEIPRAVLRFLGKFVRVMGEVGMEGLAVWTRRVALMCMVETQSRSLLRGQLVYT